MQIASDYHFVRVGVLPGHICIRTDTKCRQSYLGLSRATINGGTRSGLSISSASPTDPCLCKELEGDDGSAPLVVLGSDSPVN